MAKLVINVNASIQLHVSKVLMFFRDVNISLLAIHFILSLICTHIFRKEIYLLFTKSKINNLFSFFIGHLELFLCLHIRGKVIVYYNVGFRMARLMLAKIVFLSKGRSKIKMKQV